MGTKVCVELDSTDEPGQPAVRSYTTVIGDGTTTSYTVTHGLDTRDPLYVVRDVASGVLDGSDARGDGGRSEPAPAGLPHRRRLGHRAEGVGLDPGPGVWIEYGHRPERVEVWTGRCKSH